MKPAPTKKIQLNFQQIKKKVHGKKKNTTKDKKR